MARRFKLASALNLIGLVVSFAAFYLLMTQIIYQTTYNHGIKDYDRLYRLESDFVYNESEYSDVVCRPFADALQRFPDIVESYSLTHGGSSNESSYTSHFKKEGVTTDYAFPVTPGNNKAVSTFSPKVLDGEIEWSNEKQDGFIIPARIATAYFGTVKAAGKKMTLVDDDYVDTFRIVGVFEDFPDNSELYNRIYYNIYNYDTLNLGASYKCIVKFKSVPKDIKAFAAAYKDTIVAHLSQGLKEKGLDLKIEIEVRNFDELQQVLDHGGVDRIMLDNFSVENTRKAVELIDGKYETESSGGITIDTLRDYAEAGVDFISVGALTHSVKGLDMSFKAC